MELRVLVSVHHFRVRKIVLCDLRTLNRGIQCETEQRDLTAPQEPTHPGTLQLHCQLAIHVLLLAYFHHTEVDAPY